MGKHRHLLSDVDPDARTAICANCGPVRITSGGKNAWRCIIAKRETNKTPRRAEYMKQYGKERYERTQGRAQRTSWLKRYSLTIEDYEAMLESQGHGCAVCHRPCVTGKRLAVDHDHETGVVRGLLCNPCNRALGLLGDDLVLVKALVDYLS